MKNLKKFVQFFVVMLILFVSIFNSGLRVLAYDNGNVGSGNFLKVKATNSFNTLVTPSVNLQPKSPSSISKVAPFINDQIKNDYVDGQILVKYKNNKINLDTPSGMAASLNFSAAKFLEKKEDIKKANISVLEIKDNKTVEQKITELKNDPNVEYAEPNYRRYPAVINTNDTNKSLLWGLDNTGQTVGGTYTTNNPGSTDKDIDAPEAWTINEGTNASVIVAVIDSGVAYNHPDLAANMWNGANCKDQNGNVLGGCNHGYDYEDGDKTPLPTTSSHGTHIAGIIAATKGNGLGIMGTAPQAKIMALKYDFTIATEVKAIDFAIQNGAKVINASFTGATFSQSELDAINRFKMAGGIFVAAAGNEATNNDGGTHFYPSDYNLDNIISVAATDQNDTLATFSDYGATSVDVGAPGTNIYSAVNDTILSSENFNGVTTPNLPTGWTKTANWGTYDYSGDKVLYGDYSNTPYVNDADSDAFGPVSGLTANTTISFYAQCDTEYFTPESSDYMALEFNGGSGPVQVFKWNETTLDSLNGDSDPSGSANYYFQDYKIPTTYAGNEFRYGFKWHTDSSNVPIQNYDGCFVDDIKITRYSDGSDEKYDYKDGTSMAAPYVAGLAALIEGYNPTLSSSQVKNAILTTGDSIASLFGKTVTGKRINAQNALLAVTPITGPLTVQLVNTTATHILGDPGITNDTGRFTITFDLTAVGQDVFIDKTAPTTSGGITESDIDVDSPSATATSTSVITSTNAAEAVEGFHVTDGETKRFTITTEVSPTASGLFRVKLTDLLYAFTDVNGDLHYNTGLSDFRTDYIALSATVLTPDTIAPVVTLNGSNPIDLTVGEVFSDPGATATDNVDGSVAVIASGSVDTSTVGTYTITYTATDAALNVGTAIRTVNVNAAPVVLDSIAITTSASKLTYTVGDGLDISGLVITGTYSDATTQIETITTSNITGFDSSIPATDQVLTVTVNGKTATYTINIVSPISSSKEIHAFSFPEGSGSIDEGSHAITVPVPFGTDVTALTPTIDINGASVNPNSGVAQDFTNPVVYTVTAEDASTQDYTVTVVVAAPSDLTALVTAIALAQAKHDAAVEGNLVGQYPVPLKANLQAAIDIAATITNTSSQSVVDAAVITLNVAVVTFEAGIILPDIIAPVIILNGSSTVNIVVGGTYTEEGATATDNTDGSVAVITGGDTVDTAIAGTYHVTYDAVDTANNHAVQVIRTIIVSTPISSGGGGGSSGGGNSSRVAQTVPTIQPTQVEGCVPGYSFSPINGQRCPASTTGEVLGAQTFHFALTLKIGSKGNEVVELQKFLNKAGYNSGIPDGKFGPKTKSAVIKFQITSMLKGDGVIGQLTRAVLNK